MRQRPTFSRDSSTRCARVAKAPEPSASSSAGGNRQRTQRIRGLNSGPFRGAAQGLGPAAAPQNEGSRRLLAAAAQGNRLDTRLYTAIARETGVRIEILPGDEEARIAYLAVKAALVVRSARKDTDLVRVRLDPLELL